MLSVKSLRKTTSVEFDIAVVQKAMYKFQVAAPDYSCVEANDVTKTYCFETEEHDVEIQLQSLTSVQTQIKVEVRSKEDVFDTPEAVTNGNDSINTLLIVIGWTCSYIDGGEQLPDEEADEEETGPPPLPVTISEGVSPKKKRKMQVAEVDEEENEVVEEEEELSKAEIQEQIDFVRSHRGKMFKAPFSFKGRIRRTELWISLLLQNCISILVFIKLTLAAEADSPDLGTYRVIAVVVTLILFWSALAQNAKRCHDRGNSGVYQIIPFYIFWMLFASGDEGDNRYGEGREVSASSTTYFLYKGVRY